MIAVEDLSFRYRRHEPILEGISHRFDRGLVTVVSGRSGSGKSTLLYILGLLLSPWSGRVVLDNDDVSSMPDGGRSRLRAAEIGFVFQDAALDPSRTVMDNVCEAALYAGLPLKQARQRATVLLDHFEVGLRADHRPGEVSGGQAQRVALCRALLNRPSIVLADEPTGNLDRESADVVLDALARTAADGAVVVIASHDPDVLGRADRLLRIENDDR